MIILNIWELFEIASLKMKNRVVVF